ncbi:hypothetical protein PLESTF_001039800 [Pleodorina starrii]|nr:hypothetical protein PLESTF_001039800 [Pleodorina starrii]
MEVASRAAVDRAWRSTQKAGGMRRSCAVRVVAFNEARRTPMAHGGAGLPPGTGTAAANAPARPAIPSPPLSPDRVASLSPPALAAALLDDTQHVTPPAARTDGCSTITAREAAAAAAAAAATVTTTEARVYDAVSRRLMQGVHDFDAQSLVDILHAYGRRGGQGRSHRDVLAICCVVLSAKVDELSPAALTRLAAACARMNLRATDLLAALCARAGEPGVLSHFAPSDLAALLVALSQLQHRSPALFTDAADVLAAELLQATAAAAAGTGAAGARPWPGAGPAVGKAGSAKAALGPEEAVSAVWALAAAELYHRQVFDAAGALLMDRLGDLDGTSLAKIAWAFATVRSADESHRALWDRDLFDSIAGACLEHGPAALASFPPRALVTLMWSFAAIPHYDGPLFEALASALAPHLAARAVVPSDLVAVAWAVQRVGHSSSRGGGGGGSGAGGGGGGEGGLMVSLGEAALAAVDRLDGDDLTAIAMAFPAARAYSEAFFKYLVSEAQARPQFFGQVALLDIIRLISRVQHRDPHYYGQALQVLLDHVHKAFLDAPVDKAGCMNPFRFG